jgi:diguanylate cyclase (GGDEF)-like protein
MHTIALIALVVPSTWLLAECFYTSLGLVHANDPQATVRFITTLAGGELALFCPIVAIPISAAFSRFQDARQRLEKLANTDSLTGLLNRRGFGEAVETRWRHLNADASVAALLVDIDGFKRANDEHGHDFGDAVLCSLASLIGEAAQARDAVAARYGGEEFVILLSGLPRHEVLAIAVTLRVGFQARRIECNGVSATSTISIGVAHAVGPCDLAALIGRADAALYAAKRAGRNRIIEDLPEPHRAAA